MMTMMRAYEVAQDTMMETAFLKATRAAVAAPTRRPAAVVVEVVE